MFTYSVKGLYFHTHVRISFKTTKLEKLSNSNIEAFKKLGKQSARKLRTRMDELDTAITLEDMRFLPAARCHELKGKLQGSLAVNLHDGLRVLFIPDHEPVPAKDDGGMDWTQINAILITDITDYHD